MGLSVCTFVPEGIVIQTDSLAGIRKGDVSFSVEGGRKLFVADGRYLIDIESPSFHEGLPPACSVPALLKGEWHAGSVEDLARQLLSAFKALGEPVTAYVAGYEYPDGVAVPVVATIQGDDVRVVNRDAEGNPVYGFHAVGRTYWVHKLMMSTVGKAGEEEVPFQRFDMDFTKLSLSEAAEFASYMVSLSARMDRFSQQKPEIGTNPQTGIIRPYEELTVKGLVE